jgi:hypothetical protein
VNVGLISNTQHEIGELLKWVLLSFDQPYDTTDKVALFDRLQRHLIEQYGKGRRSVLIIDEAQNLAIDTLEELRMLSNINADKDHLMQLVLVGQPQLKNLLRRPELEQFVQRVSSDFHVEPLSLAEVAEYIRHRLGVAGRETALFDKGAIQAVHESSEGIPRRINVLCDTALVYGFSQAAEWITAALVNEVLRDMTRYGVFPGAEPDPKADPDPKEADPTRPGEEEAGDKAVLQRLHVVAGRIQRAPPADTFPTGVPARVAAVDDNHEDPLFDEAVEIVMQWRHFSTYNLKQQLKISHGRAAGLVQQMERAGVLSAPDEVGNRTVLKSPDQED